MECKQVFDEFEEMEEKLKQGYNRSYSYRDCNLSISSDRSSSSEKDIRFFWVFKDINSLDSVGEFPGAIEYLMNILDLLSFGWVTQ